MSASNVIVRTSIKRGELFAVTFNPDKRFKGGLPLTEGLCGGKLSVRKRGRGCKNSAKIKGALTPRRAGSYRAFYQSLKKFCSFMNFCAENMVSF